MDLVVFIIMEQVILHQQRRFEQIFCVGKEKAEQRKAFKREQKKLSKRTLNHDTYLTNINNWICGCLVFLTSHFLICKHLIQQKGVVDIQFFNQVHRHHKYPFFSTSNTSLIQIDVYEQSIFQTSNLEIIEEENLQEVEELYEQLIDITERVLEVLKDQQSKKNSQQIKSVEKNFKAIETMMSEVTVYKRRRTMPRTFKDHSHNTLFFN